MSQVDETAQKAEEKAKLDAEAKKKADAEAKKKADADAKKKADADAKAEAEKKAQEKSKVVTVRVICESTLGHLLLKKGDTTDDPAYVALLKTKRGKRLVEEVK